jgi:exopolyphosphatase/guanosine-5'-triphosphate,3'-diphosphate pyrophosphatase
MKTAMNRTLRAEIEELSGRFDPDPVHAGQVTRLALGIFDGLHPLHKLGARERTLLEVSAMLHDIGWSRTETRGHNKHSQDMILESELSGLSDSERGLCALVARFHRKAEPDASRHRRFASLGPRGRNTVEWLSGILRVADGLDRSHLGVVEGIECEIRPKAIVLHLSGRRVGVEEIDGARGKSSLLERLTERKIEYRSC